MSTHASSVRTALLKIAEIALSGAGLSTEVLATLDVSDSTVDDARVLATLDEIEHAVCVDSLFFFCSFFLQIVILNSCRFQRRNKV